MADRRGPQRALRPGDAEHVPNVTEREVLGHLRDAMHRDEEPLYILFDMLAAGAFQLGRVMAELAATRRELHELQRRLVDPWGGTPRGN